MPGGNKIGGTAHSLQIYNKLFVDNIESRSGTGGIININADEADQDFIVSNTNDQVFQVNSYGLIVNSDNHASIDLVVKSDNNDTMLFVDSSADTVLFGAATTANSYLAVASTGVIVNNAGAAALDFRVESDTNQNMLVVDAGSNQVNVNVAADGGACTFNVNNPSGTQAAVALFSQTDDDEPFLHFYGVGSAATAEKSMCTEAVQGAGAVVGPKAQDAGEAAWEFKGMVKMEVTDTANAITDGDYWIPIYGAVAAA